jgi:hypothetical protein
MALLSREDGLAEPVTPLRRTGLGFIVFGVFLVGRT